MAGSQTIPWNPDETTGPEISTPDATGEGMVAPGQEELVREFEEGPAPEEKLLGKFESTEDLAKAYQELERKLSDQSPQRAAEQAPPIDAPTSYTQQEAVDVYGEEAVSALADKGLDMAEIMFKADSGEDISAHYDALAETFQVPRQVVENYVNGAQAEPVAGEGLTDSVVAQIKSEVGGDAQFQQLTAWAQQNMSRDELAEYNATVDSGNATAIRWALKSMQARAMQPSQGRTEPKMLGGRPPSAEPTFTSKQQVLNAMNKRDERGRRLYDTDPSYREKIAQVLERSDVF